MYVATFIARTSTAVMLSAAKHQVGSVYVRYYVYRTHQYRCHASLRSASVGERICKMYSRMAIGDAQQEYNAVIANGIAVRTCLVHNTRNFANRTVSNARRPFIRQRTP